MCHESGSRPPVPPPTPAGRVGGVASVRSLRLGDVLAYEAVPAVAGGAGVVLLPDVRGLHDFYRDLARRFASLGIAALAIDYYGRTAPSDARDSTFDGFAHVGSLRPDQVAADVRSAVDALLAAGARSLFTVGFCLGGAMSWAQSAVDDRLAGAIGFYGRPSECWDLIPRMSAPLLVLAAGADMLTPADEARGFDRDLTEAGVPHRFVLYEGAPHSFFDGDLVEHTAAADDAWRQVLSFISEHS